MENLELLLQEKSEIGKKIQEAGAGLKQWFETKIEQSKTIGEKVKESISSKLKKASKKGSLKKDIKLGGEILAKAGDSFSKVASKVSSALSDVNSLISEIINKCKNAIKKLFGGKASEVESDKVEVTKKSKSLTQKVMMATTLVAGIVGVGVGVKYGSDAVENLKHRRNTRVISDDEKGSTISSKTIYDTKYEIVK